jgi:hypothetical protein
MGLFGYMQRRELSKNTRQMAALLADQNSLMMTGKTVAQRQIEATDAMFRETVDRAVRSRCKGTGMSDELTEAFLLLNTQQRIAWTQAHPQYHTGYLQ